MAIHKLQITYTLDDANPDADTLLVKHFVTVHVAGYNPTHWETVELDDEAAAKEMFKALLESNREKMQAITAPLAVNHAAALMNLIKGPHLKIGGTLSPSGKAVLKKEPPAGT